MILGVINDIHVYLQSMGYICLVLGHAHLGTPRDEPWGLSIFAFSSLGDFSDVSSYEVTCTDYSNIRTTLSLNQARVKRQRERERKMQFYLTRVFVG